MIINPYIIAPPSSGEPTNLPHLWWRALITSNESASGVLRYTEIQMADASNTTNFALGATALSSNGSYVDPSDSSVHPDTNAFDGDFGNWWGTEGFTDVDGVTNATYIGVQLAEAQTIAFVYFYGIPGTTEDDMSSGITVQSSDDGETWLDEFTGYVFYTNGDGSSVAVYR